MYECILCKFKCVLRKDIREHLKTKHKWIKYGVPKDIEGEIRRPPLSSNYIQK